MKRNSYLVLVLAVCFCLFGSLQANAQTSSQKALHGLKEKKELYIPSKPRPTIMERGRCTDVYPKDWCNAHGYKNNRPVGASVTLNSREKKCLEDFYLDSARNILISGVTMNPAGIYIGTPYAAIKLWRCLR